MNLTGALSCNGTTTELHFKVDFAIFPNGLSLCLMTSTERLTFLEITIGLYIGPYSIMSGRRSGAYRYSNGWIAPFFNPKTISHFSAKRIRFIFIYSHNSTYCYMVICPRSRDLSWKTCIDRFSTITLFYQRNIRLGQFISQFIFNIFNLFISRCCPYIIFLGIFIIIPKTGKVKIFKKEFYS